MWLFSKGTQWAKCSVPTESDVFMSLVHEMDLATSFTAKPCTRDLMDMYVSKQLCEVLPVKPAALAAALMSWTEASS